MRSWNSAFLVQTCTLILGITDIWYSFTYSYIKTKISTVARIRIYIYLYYIDKEIHLFNVEVIECDL